MRGSLEPGERMILSNYGGLLATPVDNRDRITALPSDAKEAPPASTRPAIPALSDVVRASLQGVGTSLRIELDVGQLTDLVLRDIMMNKPNVFGGIG